MPRRHHQSGFALIETLLITTIIISIGAIGYYVYKVHNQKENKVVQQSDNLKPGSIKNNAAETGDTFRFTQLGVSIVVSPELAGLSYSEDKTTPDLYDTTTASFKKQDTSCAGFFAQIYRGEGAYDAALAREHSGGRLLKQFDGYYIGANIPWCTADSEIALNHIDALQKAFTTAVEIN